MEYFCLVVALVLARGVEREFWGPQNVRGHRLSSKYLLLMFNNKTDHMNWAYTSRQLLFGDFQQIWLFLGWMDVSCLVSNSFTILHNWCTPFLLGIGLCQGHVRTFPRPCCGFYWAWVPQLFFDWYTYQMVIHLMYKIMETCWQYMLNTENICTRHCKAAVIGHHKIIKVQLSINVNIPLYTMSTDMLIVDNMQLQNAKIARTTVNTVTNTITLHNTTGWLPLAALLDRCDHTLIHTVNGSWLSQLHF